MADGGVVPWFCDSCYRRDRWKRYCVIVGYVVLCLVCFCCQKTDAMRWAYDDGVAYSGGQNSDGLGLAAVFCRFVEAKVRKLALELRVQYPIDIGNNIISTTRTPFQFSID